MLTQRNVRPFPAAAASVPAPSPAPTPSPAHPEGRGASETHDGPHGAARHLGP